MEVLKIIIVLCLCWFASVKAGIEQDALAVHNRLRKLHGVPPLKLSPDLNKKAADHAKLIARVRHMQFSIQDNEYSENLCQVNDNPGQCSKLWYSSIEHYNFWTHMYNHEAAYFSNMIWSASTEMGYGQAKDVNGKYYVVAMYTPPAIGDFAKNVPFPLSEGGDRYSVPPQDGDEGESTTSKSGRIAVQINAITVSILLGLFKLTY